uniref:Tyrosine phosphatase n=1 Tax=Pristionchus pacificus TaxID=54126 RepID=A0A8R1Y442_PRIPA
MIHSTSPLLSLSLFIPFPFSSISLRVDGRPLFSSIDRPLFPIMGGSSSKPVSKAPSVEEKKRTLAKKPSTPATRSKDTPKTTPEKVTPEKTARRIDRTAVTSDPDANATTPVAKRKRDEGENRTAKEIVKSKESQKKKKKSVGKYVDGNFVSAEGPKKKHPTPRSTPKTGSSEERKKNISTKSGSGKKASSASSEKSKRRVKKPETSVEKSTERTVDEKTQDSSGRRKRASRKGKSVDVGRSAEDLSKKTEQTEQTEKTKDENTVPTFEDDNTLVSDAPKRKKYSEDKEENVKAFLKLILGKGVKGLKEEFAELKKEIIVVKKDEVNEIYSEFSLPINAPKNRYKDVPRLNESKVVLKDRKDDQSYIHANYCSTPKGEKRFICTQGPNESTYNDFWWMIWHEEVEFIAMLCNFIEMNKPKCDKYFPMDEGEILSTQDFSIQCMAVHGNKWPETVTIRKLSVTKKDGDKDHTVHHLHWESWPDRGVPPIDSSIFKLLARVSKSTKPIAVHCSAGIGRTGTMVVVQIAMEMLSTGESLSGGLAPILKKLRGQRAMSVQTENQYIFIHRVLLDYFKDAIDDDETAQFCAEYDALTK